MQGYQGARITEWAPHVFAIHLIVRSLHVVSWTHSGTGADGGSRGVNENVIRRRIRRLFVFRLRIRRPVSIRLAIALARATTTMLIAPPTAAKEAIKAFAAAKEAIKAFTAAQVVQAV